MLANEEPMKAAGQKAMASPDTLAAAFEHSITWEDDVWQADPVDVPVVHQKARDKFYGLLDDVVATKGATGQARILLFHGQSGAGKTHLIRALRTGAHRKHQAYFGYVQMTPDISNYADYFLRRLINSLEKPYDPDDRTEGAENSLSRLTRLMVEASLPAGEVQNLREAQLDETALAMLVLNLADDIVASAPFSDKELDINIIRALLYLVRRDPRIDQRVRQYLAGRELNELSMRSVCALDANFNDGRAFEIIEALGTIMSVVDDAALVFCIDQVEDLRNFDDPEDRFTKAVGNLMQIANRIPTSIVIITVLEEFYAQARAVLHQSYVDRIEKSGPVALHESRTAEEARQIIVKRLEYGAGKHPDGANPLDPSVFFGPEFFEEFAGLSTRRLLEHAQSHLRSDLQSEPERPETPNSDSDSGSGSDSDSASASDTDPAPVAEPLSEETGFISKLAAALGFTSDSDALSRPSPGDEDHFTIDYRELWERFCCTSEAEMPNTDEDLLDVLSASLKLTSAEWNNKLHVTIKPSGISDDLPAVDINVAQPNGHSYEARIYLCNRPTQGGGLKRQLDKVLGTMKGRTSYILRASEFPPNRKNQTAQVYRKFRDAGGRSVLVPIFEWERMMMIREFHAHHRNDPGFTEWFSAAKMMSGLVSIIQILRLDLLGHLPPINGTRNNAAMPATAALSVIDEVNQHFTPSGAALEGGSSENASQPALQSAAQAMPQQLTHGENTATSSGAPWADWLGWNNAPPPPPSADNDDEVPISVLLDENGDNVNSIFAGRELHSHKPVTLNRGVMKRHSAVLGGSGSGKTTLALSLIEQFLARGIPAILIDRKGDLCSYANPDVWRTGDLSPERAIERKKLGDSIDVAVYTPGRASGRPISITLLPNGMDELPSHEQQFLASLSAAALGDMLHLKRSATHQKQLGVLSVALHILGTRSRHEVSLPDLIAFLEDEDPELTELTQRIDPSGNMRRNLVAQLEALRYRNAALFDAGGESLRMDAFLGIGPYARAGRTRLSIIYTGFLGDNENILFWVAQFLSEALRFCQRNPNDELQAVVMLDEADLYIPANAKPITSEPLQSLLKRARSAGLGLMLATQSPGDLDYKSRDQITSWFIGRVREDTALRKLKAAFQAESGLDPAAVLPHQTVGQFHLVQEGLVRSLKAQRSLIMAEQVPFDRIEQLARETRGLDQNQLKLFDLK
ncbi:MAG: helicase HerA-like domain-containing protein [Pseudomonadota bacterium]